jgi:hypothetical protein
VKTPGIATTATILTIALSATAALSQTTEQLRTMPSSAEFLELVNKADEKIQEFQRSIKSAEPFLDRETLKTDYEAADNARTIVSAIRKNGMSNYALVGLLSSLDDLTLDASRATRVIILGISQNQQQDTRTATSTVMTLMQSENSLYDISDLLLHAGLRFAGAEDDLWEKVAKSAK